MKARRALPFLPILLLIFAGTVVVAQGSQPTPQDALPCPESPLFWPSPLDEGAQQATIFLGRTAMRVTERVRTPKHFTETGDRRPHLDGSGHPHIRNEPDEQDRPKPYLLVLEHSRNRLTRKIARLESAREHDRLPVAAIERALEGVR
jgi:hypothetical protein